MSTNTSEPETKTSHVDGESATPKKARKTKPVNPKPNFLVSFEIVYRVFGLNDKGEYSPKALSEERIYYGTGDETLEAAQSKAKKKIKQLQK